VEVVRQAKANKSFNGIVRIVFILGEQASVFVNFT